MSANTAADEGKSMAGHVVSRIGGVGMYGIALVVGAFLTYYWFNSNFFSPADANKTESVPFIVDRGASLKSVAKNLEEQQFVRNWWAVWFLAKMQGNRLIENNVSKIKAGEYSIAPSDTPLEILKKFEKEEIVYHSVMVPPGSTLKDVKALLVASTLATPEEVDKVLNNTAILARLVSGSSFEGYLFPETYRFTRPDNAETMLTRMVEEGRKRISQQMHNRAREFNYSIHQILTLASIIEKETGNSADRKTISSVFHNRLRLNMPLQSDPTVIYGIRGFDGNLTRAHLEAAGPYNTYLNRNLPPTPICNPGIESIEAALYPADTDYLYFVGKGDGTSHFSSNYREHREAVRRYQIDPARAAAAQAK